MATLDANGKEIRGITKRDVTNAFLEVIIQLAKNNFSGARVYMKKAEYLFERWMTERPEKKSAEKKKEKSEETFNQ